MYHIKKCSIMREILSSIQFVRHLLLMEIANVDKKLIGINKDDEKN